MATVSIIGACGHVGFPFSVIVANAGHKVYGIDINQKLCDQMNIGVMPYIEHGADQPFTKAINSKSLEFTCDYSKIQESDVVAIMIGTPVDSEGNPRLDDILDFVDVELSEWMKPGTLVILRSTVSPGTTEIIRDLLEKKNCIEGKDYHLVFCPERVAQAYGIEETKKLPQLIGAFSEESYKVAENFFKTFLEKECFWLFPREAEVGKLVTNMYRYVNFALANEFYIIADKQGVDIHRITDAVNKDYNRMALPKPGPNVGGPCLFKDGKFLLTDLPFTELINTSFTINEGMPDYVFNRIKQINPRLKKVLVLGLTFKAECDDIRNSLSFKFKKVCKKNGVEAVAIDPFIYNSDDKYINLKDFDAVVVMTPHKKFREMFGNMKDFFNDETIIADVWKLFDSSKLFSSGIYKVKDADGSSLTDQERNMYRKWGYL